MYCPLCGAEFRPGFAMCSDCQVPLVADPPRGASANASDHNSDETSFALVWSGNDAHIHTEICDALGSQKIPARTLGSEDHLFNLTTHAAFEVYVPVDLVDSAREAIRQAQLIPDEDTEQPSESDLLEIPAEDAPSDDDPVGYEEHGDSRNLDPQDAAVEIWSGPDTEMAAMIASSLRENDILYRSDPDLSDLAGPPDIAESEIAVPGSANTDAPQKDTTRFFVFPEDEKQAKEIVREIIDAVPPE